MLSLNSKLSPKNLCKIRKMCLTVGAVGKMQGICTMQGGLDAGRYQLCEPFLMQVNVPDGTKFILFCLFRRVANCIRGRSFQRLWLKINFQMPKSKRLVHCFRVCYELSMFKKLRIFKLSRYYYYPAAHICL